MSRSLLVDGLGVRLKPRNNFTLDGRIQLTITAIAHSEPRHKEQLSRRDDQLPTNRLDHNQNLGPEPITGKCFDIIRPQL